MSTRSKLFYLIMKIIDYRAIIVRQFLAVVKKGEHSDSDEKTIPPAKLSKSCTVLTNHVLGSKVFTLVPKSGTRKTVILYFHGGAYIRGAVKQHWDFVSHFVRNTGCTVVVPDYPLAPQYGYKDVFERMEMVYRDLIGKHQPENIILMGDSAGGGLALALAQRLRDIQVVQPAQIIMLSPWLDISMTHPGIPDIQKKDPFLSAIGLKAAGEAYAKDLSTKNRLVSPVYGDFHGLGKLSLFTGTYDILCPDARKLKSICDQQGIPLNYFEYPKMVHVWMLLGFPESEKVIGQIGSLIG